MHGSRGGSGGLPLKIQISLNHTIKLQKIYASDAPWQTQITVGPPPPWKKKLGSAHDERGLPLIESLYHKATLLYFALITQQT